MICRILYMRSRNQVENWLGAKVLMEAQMVFYTAHESTLTNL